MATKACMLAVALLMSSPAMAQDAPQCNTTAAEVSQLLSKYAGRLRAGAMNVVLEKEAVRSIVSYLGYGDPAEGTEVTLLELRNGRGEVMDKGFVYIEQEGCLVNTSEIPTAAIRAIVVAALGVPI